MLCYNKHKETLMKKLLCFLFALCATFTFSSCALLLGDLDSLESSSVSESSQSVDKSSSSETSKESSSVEEENSIEEETSEKTDLESETSEEQTSESEDKPDDSPTYKFTDFSEEDKDLFLTYIGELIPFAPTDEYDLEGYTEELDFENGINYYTLGNTKEDFEAYLALYADYTFVETYYDDYGDLWYCYKNDSVIIDLAYYFYEGEYWIDVFVCLHGEGGNDGWEDEETGGDVSDVDLITNKGKGLPKGVNGIYNVDFTKATYVKNVTEQGYYLDGCPTTSSPAVLVIPVEFSDVRAASKGYSVTKIEKAFNGGAGETDYYSVHDYYYTSSYGKLDIEFTVLNTWFRPKYSSSYYKSQTMDYYGCEQFIGDQLIMDEALASLSNTMDLSKFDSDGNGIIDAVVMINTLDIDSDVDFQWAYRFWNIYTNASGEYYEYDNVSANDYLWASYQFMHENLDRTESVSYDNPTLINTYTYIHEFGHVLGADDYYDTAYIESPLNGYDIMDAYIGDHNPYTKFNYGWLTNSRLVVADGTLTVTLEDFSKNGDTLLIANNWDEDLGVYQEYYALIYYKNTKLNGDGFGYFEEEGILVYHVNASLYRETEGGTTYYDVYNTNTNVNDPNGYGTKDNLIEFILSTKGNYVYGVGDTLSKNTKDDQGNRIAYTFTVDALTSDSATITFKKNA